MQTTTRNATMQDMAVMLQEQHGRKLDIVTSAAAIRSEGGVIVVSDSDAELGITMEVGRFVPTTIFDEGLSEKLGIPLAYVRKMRDVRPDLYDVNVNGWLHGNDTDPGDPRSFMFRGFTGDDDGPGIARALLSNSYRRMDNLDTLLAALDGVRQSGADVDIVGCDLTDRRMYVRVASKNIAVNAKDLLGDYRSPYSGNVGADNPLLFAGFVLSNSEVGNGAFTITPRAIFQVCTNGMTITKDAARSVHLGESLSDGIVNWSEDTEKKNLALVTAKTRDTVATFLDAAYWETAVENLEEQAGIKVSDPVATVKAVSKTLAFSDEVSKGILDHFIRGGSVTAGGVMQAVTSFAQTVDSGDLAYDMEGSALRALDLAAALH